MSKSEIKPDWIKIKPVELEELIVKLYKEGNTPAKIGLILRDKHGIPKAKVIGKRISKILAEAEIKIPGLKEQTEKKIDNLKQHIDKNKKDYSAGRSLAKSLWITNKLKN